jgi:hypothetical protein
MVFDTVNGFEAAVCAGVAAPADPAEARVGALGAAAAPPGDAGAAVCAGEAVALEGDDDSGVPLAAATAVLIALPNCAEDPVCVPVPETVPELLPVETTLAPPRLGDALDAEPVLAAGV